jgi:hypothetical protein
MGSEERGGKSGSYCGANILGGGRFPSSLRGWRMVFEGLRKNCSHWGWEWGSAGALESLKIEVFLIGDENWGTAEYALNYPRLPK